MKKFLRRVIALEIVQSLLTCLVAVACGAGGDGSGPPTLPPPLLGDLQAEVDYFDTSGHGAVIVVQDFNLPDPCTHPSGTPGHYIIKINPLLMAGLPPGVGEFFLRHEFGHAYLQHIDQPPVDPRRFEHLADAYGIRVLQATGGSTPSSEALAFFEATPTAQDASHPSHATRAHFMRQVLAALAVTPGDVPAPPSGVGTLTVRNPFGEVCVVFLNSTPLGTLPPGGFGSQQLYGDLFFGDAYVVQLVGFFSGFLYSTAVVTIFSDQVTIWP